MRKLSDEQEMDVAPLPRSESSTLLVLRAALADLHRHHISYCYWKSSRNILSVLAGERCSHGPHFSGVKVIGMRRQPRTWVEWKVGGSDSTS